MGCIPLIKIARCSEVSAVVDMLTVRADNDISRTATGANAILGVDIVDASTVLGRRFL